MICLVGDLYKKMKYVIAKEFSHLSVWIVMTYTEIIKEIWKWSDSGSIKKLQVNMANIRKKMGCKPGEYQYILNELGVGYRFNID